jgi:hypothetical protein
VPCLWSAHFLIPAKNYTKTPSKRHHHQQNATRTPPKLHHVPTPATNPGILFTLLILSKIRKHHQNATRTTPRPLYPTGSAETLSPDPRHPVLRSLGEGGFPRDILFILLILSKIQNHHQNTTGFKNDLPFTPLSSVLSRDAPERIPTW